MTRLAASPSELWQGILAENADYVNEALREFARQLPAAGDLATGHWVPSAFARAGAAREQWRTGAAGSPPRSNS
jgi:prephenate dehydrogenase